MAEADWQAKELMMTEFLADRGSILCRATSVISMKRHGNAAQPFWRRSVERGDLENCCVTIFGDPENFYFANTLLSHDGSLLHRSVSLAALAR
jgi:hypothetical protein